MWHWVAIVGKKPERNDQQSILLGLGSYEHTSANQIRGVDDLYPRGDIKF